MKETFIATSGSPGTGDFIATMFTMESANAVTAEEMKDLARMAAKRYAITEEGRTAYAANGDNFNWGDLLNNYDNPVFRDICDSLGLEISWLGSAPETDGGWIDHDEPLMNDIPVFISDIEWDTDGELVEGLPNEESLVLDDPHVEIADALSDKHEFCVAGFEKIEVRDF